MAFKSVDIVDFIVLDYSKTMTRAEAKSRLLDKLIQYSRDAGYCKYGYKVRWKSFMYCLRDPHEPGYTHKGSFYIIKAKKCYLSLAEVEN